ncbi:MAG TPA: hypothetical protein VHU84_17585, partial [Lacipirellulaceae bacterium]|nr:hypothetical protein [Lacipirellulaceae bacterium]
ARQLCADTADFSPEDFQRIAESVRDTQLQQLMVSLETVTRRFFTSPDSIVVSGGGEFLAVAAAEAKWPGCQKVALSQQIGLSGSRCAPAFALAVLAESDVSRT